ncbi:MAG: ATPase, T2SS/T4P/T4SS family, partial [Aeromonas veronii]
MSAYHLDGSVGPAPLPELPFVFARNFGVILIERDGAPVLQCRPGVTPQALLEVRRVAGCSFAVEQLDNEAFEELLMAHYQRDSSEARQLMEDLGNEMDFFALAEELPQSEDLLDADDDAPIIRLINAMLSEAIKEEASDIHIETFERALVIRFRIDGVLREILRPHRKLASLLVSRIKVMSRM